MKPETRRYLFDAPGVYRIRVQGRLDRPGVERLPCMRSFKSRVRGLPPTTTITGPLVDQASLLGVLTQLYDMGYPLLDVRRLSQDAAAEPAESEAADDRSGPPATSA